MTYILALVILAAGAPHTAEVSGYLTRAACMAQAKALTSHSIAASCYRAEFHDGHPDCRLTRNGRSYVLETHNDICVAILARLRGGK